MQQDIEKFSSCGVEKHSVIWLTDNGNAFFIHPELQLWKVRPMNRDVHGSHHHVITSCPPRSGYGKGGGVGKHENCIPSLTPSLAAHIY